MGRDVVAQAMLEVLGELNILLEAEGWDRPPSLWGVRRELSADGLGLTLQRLPTGRLLTDGHPAEGVARLAVSGSRPPVPLFAVVLVSEAWMVMSAGEQDAEVARAQGLDRHPRRVETRMLVAIDVAGFRYSVVVPRDTAKAEVVSVVNRPGDAPEGMSVDGRVHATLAQLMEVWS